MCASAWVALVCLSAGAQDAVPARLVVDPDSAALLAIRNSVDLRISAASVKEAEARLRQVRTLDNPQVDLGLSLLYRGPKPSLPPVNRPTAQLCLKLSCAGLRSRAPTVR